MLLPRWACCCPEMKKHIEWKKWRNGHESDEHHLVDSAFTAFLRRLTLTSLHHKPKKSLIFISHQAVLQFRVRRSLSAQTGSPFTTQLLTIKCHPEQSGFYIFSAFTVCMRGWWGRESAMVGRALKKHLRLVNMFSPSGGSVCLSPICVTASRVN